MTENVNTKQPQVDYVLEKLEKEIDSLQKNINVLENNLAQILTIPVSKECDGKVGQSEHFCELAHKINNLFRRIEYMNEQITVIIKGLEISPSIVPEISKVAEYKAQ